MAEVLVLGSGGRERAIEQSMNDSSEVSRVVVDSNIESGLASFSGSTEKPFVIIGPEAPLVAGAADELREDGYTVFGASKAAAQYEASKSKTTKLARRVGVVHPATHIVEGKNMADEAMQYVDWYPPEEYVIKADGLAGGKGVVLPNTKSEAIDVVQRMITGELFDGAGKEIINFQDRHHGPEVSAMVVVGSGKDDFVVLPLSQDHKRLLNNDRGPNTGGMGAYATVPEKIVNDGQYAKIEEAAHKLLAGMEDEGAPYRGAVMYMGQMMSEEARRYYGDDASDLIEINVRFGDPETQVIFPLMQHAGVDMYRLLRSAAEGSLEVPSIDLRNIGSAALTVCLAAKGYPDSPVKGDKIFGLDRTYEGVTVQLAGVKDGDVTNGGRVLYVTGVGENIDQAAARAYAAIGENAIYFSSMQYRTDIGWQARTK